MTCRRWTMMMASLVGGWSATVVAVEPMQFASGIELRAQIERPVLELMVPDIVYAGVTEADLTDLRVFNARQLPVPHALCELPSVAPRIEDQPLPVFSLQAPPQVRDGDVDVHVRGGSEAVLRVEVQPASRPDGTQPAVQRSGYVIDARPAPGAIRALRLKWQTADAASEVAVRVEASDDLDRWHTIVARTTLLRVDAAGSALERMRIVVPEADYSYLRLARADSGPPPNVEQVIAESVVPAEEDEAALRWFDAQAMPLPAQMPGFGFDAGRRAPVQRARVELPSSNMALTLRLQSRMTTAAPWQTRWSGEVFALGNGDGQRRSGDIRFGAIADRYWRLLVTDGADSLGAAALQLRLAYRPARLRFLAQGDGPFTLAYGSGRAEAAPRRACADLLRQLPQAELDVLIGAAVAGETRVLGGDAALQPAPEPLPTRRIVLWSLLVLGAALLIAMALSLLRRTRR